MTLRFFEENDTKQSYESKLLLFKILIQTVKLIFLLIIFIQSINYTFLTTLYILIVFKNVCPTPRRHPAAPQRPDKCAADAGARAVFDVGG